MARNKKYPLDQQKLIELLQNHKDHLTSMSKWNVYSKEHDLPHSQTIIKYFGTWNKVKEALSLEQQGQSRPPEYTDEMLLEYLDRYKEEFTSISEWNTFAKTNQLPSYYTFTRHLGTEIVEQKTMTMVWDKNKLKRLILSYFPETPPTVTKWMEVANKEKLPSHMTIVRHFKSWTQMKYEVYRS